MSLVTPPKTVTLPSGISTIPGYQRPNFMVGAGLKELLFGLKSHAFRRPSSSMAPTSAGSPALRSMAAGSSYQSVPPAIRTRPSYSTVRSPQNMSPSFLDASSGDEVGSWDGPPNWPHVLPTRPSPGRPGTPAMPRGSSVLLWPGLMLGFDWPPRSFAGTIHSGVPVRRSTTRDWSSRTDGESDMALGPLAFCWPSNPL